ncbi:DUF2189 domain-containing protein [Pelagibacterium lacus]|uniref:DUF2189 domain-containing protein n=1 Tax=Pelagibacterium lacus TaxID=2282655 RepID=A0A369W4I7_9HYPH|nr:DUF2189 domain-containing protein [Pelagibacterium lacus]RDE08250.1 DUF2189 domain-containing protein [Pelagibacterium lacus]
MPVPHAPTLSGADESHVSVHSVTMSDLSDALRKGVSDFWRHPSHYLFIALIYPVMGIVLAVWSAGGSAFSLLYPLATGFALLGPVAALGLYELSRRREQGLDDSPRHALSVLHHPAIGSMLVVGLYLAVVFAAWLAAAAALYNAFLGANPPEGILELITATLTTPAGQGLLLWGNVVGIGFALLVLATTAIAFPLLVDRGGSAGRAIATSIRAFFASPATFLAWGLIVAAILLVASIPLFVGLAIALPILGHATWHLYRKATD